jgi:hypothetical protein
LNVLQLNQQAINQDLTKASGQSVRMNDSAEPKAARFWSSDAMLCHDRC